MNSRRALRSVAVRCCVGDEMRGDPISGDDSESVFVKEGLMLLPWRVDFDMVSTQLKVVFPKIVRVLNENK